MRDGSLFLKAVVGDKSGVNSVRVENDYNRVFSYPISSYKCASTLLFPHLPD